MVLYFLRHAEADPDAGRDFDRQLTVKGLEQAGKVGKFLIRFGLLPELIISSPVIRALQTARIVAKRLDAEVIPGDWLACGMSPETCRRKLSEFSKTESLMLVGHEPDFSLTIAALLGAEDPGVINVRKASLTAIDLRAPQAGRGELQFIVPVRLM